MKFFILILAEICIYIGQATDKKTTITVSVDDMSDTGSDIVRTVHAPSGNEIQFLRDVDEGDLTYSMELNGDNPYSSEDVSSRDFCEDTVHARNIRGALLPEGKTSCPVRKKTYHTKNQYDVSVSNAQASTITCGRYKAAGKVESNGDVILETQLSYNLDKDQIDCQS